MSNYQVFQQWLVYFSSQPWAIALGSIAIFWIVMQLLSNKWAGGILFERKFAWISSAIASFVVFLVFVLPNISAGLLVGILVCAGLGLVAWLLKKFAK